MSDEVGGSGDGAELGGGDEPLDVFVVLWGTDGEGEFAVLVVLVGEVEEDCVGVGYGYVSLWGVVYDGWDFSKN